MELGESRRRLGAWLLAGVGAVALAAAGPAGVRADQSNDSSSTTTAAADDPVVAPVTGAVQVNVACPANVNVLADQDGTGSCAPGAQGNANSSSTTAGGDSPGLAGGTLVAPVTTAAQINLSCPINVNVVSRQRDSGNCAPGDQSNSNSADTRVRGGGTVADVLGGPLVAPVTSGVGLNVTCPTDVDVLSAQQSSGDCVAGTGSSDGPPASPSPGTTGTPPDGPPPETTQSGPSPVQTSTGPVATAGLSQVPGPPATGAFGMGGAGGFPVLGALVLAVLAAAAVAVRRSRQETRRRVSG
jgi:hypothetical protein